MLAQRFLRDISVGHKYSGDCVRRRVCGMKQTIPGTQMKSLKLRLLLGRVHSAALCGSTVNTAQGSGLQRRRFVVTL